MKTEDKKIKEMRSILKIQSEIRRILAERLRNQQFIEISPVILSSITDPLNHPVSPSYIKCYGKNYSITQSMIFHKQIALKTLEKIFIFSPNVRIERQKKKDTGRHLFEFSQLDLEIKNATREDLMSLCEDLLVNLISDIKKYCKNELTIINRKLSIPISPFKRITYRDAYKLYGKDFEMIISKKYHDPIWIIDIPIEHREFYDKEDNKNPGYLKDMDLIYPEGYGEALSGGEREYQYERIKQRILRKGQNFNQFKDYLEIAKDDLPPSAGFGIGIERLTRFICGLKRIEDTSLFPKIPGKSSI